MTTTASKRTGVSICLVALFGALVPLAEGRPPPMTYQGQLKSDGLPVTDTADFLVRLWDAQTDGEIVAGFEPISGVKVVNGLFTIELLIDTDPSVVFSGRTKYLELLVAVPADTEPVSLRPRQPITPAPFAAYALDAPTGNVPDSPWQSAGNDIYYVDGFVGIGVTEPTAPLHVTRDPVSGPTIFARSTGSSGTAIYGYGEYADGVASGVRGETDSESGSGVKGKAWKTTGTAAGVFGQSLSPDGVAVKGTNYAGGWAGYFGGKTKITTRLEVGTAPSGTNLDITGKAEMDGFRLTANPAAGYVLTSDASGVGTWQQGSFSLPFTGSVSHNGSAMSVTNSGTSIGSHAIYARVDNAAGHGDAAAGYFVSTGTPNSAVIAAADGSSTVYATNSGTGNAYWGRSGGVAAYFTGTGNSSASVHAKATGNYATAIKAESAGAEGAALYALSTGAYGTSLTARNTSTQPTILVRNAGTGDLIKARGSANSVVFKVSNDGTTTVSVLEITGGADLSEQFDVGGETTTPGTVVCIDPENAGKLTVCTEAYDRKVAGVISGAGGVKTGMMMGQKGSTANGAHPVALTGRVFVRADASTSRIQPGDLLTTSDRAGCAMRVIDHHKAQGAIIGKAMTPLDSGRGLVLVLVSLQ